MKTMNPTQHEESAYAMLVRSEKEERSLPETGVYLLLILCTAFAVWQSAQQPFKLPNVQAPLITHFLFTAASGWAKRT